MTASSRSELWATVERARTFLFVPGDRPDSFGTGQASRAGMVVLDLEDAVPPERKDKARREVAAFLSRSRGCAVRINGVSAPWHAADLDMLTAYDCAVMVSKAQDPDVIAALAGRVPGGRPIIALIETAVGMLNAHAVASVAEVARLAFGSFDFAAELGVSPEDRDAMAAARQQLVLASAAAGIPGPIDGVTAEFTNDGALSSDVEYSKRLGMSGKLCIHPRQVLPADAGLRPSEAELSWATRVVAAADAFGDGVGVVDGRMVDKPVADRARPTLASHVTGRPPSEEGA